MNQQGNNPNMDASLQMLINGLSGLAENLEQTVRNTYSNMSQEDAIKFAEELSKHKVPEKMQDMEKDINNLRKDFKF